jgi:hypothetical protein
MAEPEGTYMGMQAARGQQKAQGDVFVMNESGKTVSQYAVPSPILRQ